MVNATDSDIEVDVKHLDSSSSGKVYNTMDSECSFKSYGSIPHVPETEENITKYKEACVDRLSSRDVATKLVDKLHESENLDDFMKLIENLSNRELPMDNIVLLLMLERARFQSCTNTIGMRYRQVTKLFWSVVYRLCKSTGLKNFSGQKNWGQVVSKETEKSKYCPNRSKINFAVPSEYMLRHIDKRLPKVIPPGKIYQCLDLLQDEKDIVLMADGKLVTKGLKEDFCGDVYLFGHESEPNLQKLESEIYRNLEFVSDSIRHYKNASECDKFDLLRDMVHCVSQLLIKIRKYVSEEQRKLIVYSKSEFSEQKYQKVISACKTNIYTSAIWIRKALRANLNLNKLMAKLQKNDHMFSSSTRKHLCQIANVRLLYPSEYIMSRIDPFEYPHLMKRGSEMFNDILRQSYVTSQTIYKALGLSGVKLMRQHFRYFVEEVGPQPDELSAKYDGIATLSNIIIPALLPSCAVLYEEGCRFLNGKHRKHVLCSSNHWIIRHHHTTNEKHWKCNHLLDMEYNNILVTFDCNNSTVVHNLSRANACNALVSMRILKCMKSWYIVVGEHSVGLIESTYNGTTWNHLLDQIGKHFDRKKPICPAKVTEMKSLLYPVLDDYILNNTRCIMEVPRLEDIYGNIKLPQKFAPYNNVKYPERSENSALTEDSFESVCYDIADIIEEGYNFLHVEASEILAFVATNSRRIIQPGIPPHIPVAYGMRGHSLSMDTMRKMVNDIRNEMQKRNTSVLCEVYDGQFHKLNVRSEKGEPLTRIQLMLDHFNDVMHNNDRQDLLSKIMPYSEVDKDDVEVISNMEFPINGILQLNSVILSFSTTVNEDDVTTTGSIGIEMIPVGGYSMRDIVTHYRQKLWDKYNMDTAYESGVSKLVC